MANGIETLLGLGLGPQDDMKALASSLRKEQAIGDYFSGSSSPRMAQYGQRLAERTGDEAKTGGALRQTMAKEATRKGEREQDYTRGLEASTLAHTRRLEHAAAQKKADTLKFDDFKPYVRDGKSVYISQKGSEVFELDENGDIQRTTMEGVSPYEKPTSGRSSKGGIYTEFGSPKQQGEFEKLAQDSQNQMVVFEQFKTEYGNASGLPIGGLKTAWTGAGLPSTDTMDERQIWWKDFNDQYVNIKRHDLFGSALTESEQRAWKNANVHENSTPEQVEDSMATLKYLTRKLAVAARENAKIKNRNPEYIAKQYGWLDNYSEFVDLSKVPEGMIRNEWEELTYKEREEVLDMGII